MALGGAVPVLQQRNLSTIAAKSGKFYQEKSSKKQISTGFQRSSTYLSDSRIDLRCGYLYTAIKRAEGFSSEGLSAYSWG